MSSCRRSAALLEILRFGEMDERSQAHVIHLQYCAACQAAIADERALTRQIERALHARIDGIAPSPSAWHAVERRITTQPPARRWRWARWLALPAGGLASAAAASALAIFIVVSGQPGERSAPESGTPARGERAMALTGGAPFSGAARVPAEQLRVPAPPDMDGVVMEALYARPAKDPGGEAVLAALLGKGPVPDSDDAPHDETQGQAAVIVAYALPDDR